MEDFRMNYNNDINGYHYVCLRILRNFDKICRKNNIEYWLTDGTLLGAVRHKGFIPWDDDIDVCVNKKDYERLLRVLEEELPQDMFLQTYKSDKEAAKKLFLQEEDESTKYNYCKIRDKKSLAIEKGQGAQTYHNGIWLDIFPMSEIKKNVCLNKILKKIPQDNFNCSIVKRNLKKFLLILIKIFGFSSFSNLKKRIKKNLSKNTLKNNYLIYMDGELWWHMYKKEDIYPLKEIEFEGYKFLAPRNEKNYLKSYYGKNFMDLPPLDKQISHCEKFNILKN